MPTDPRNPSTAGDPAWHIHRESKEAQAAHTTEVCATLKHQAGRHHGPAAGIGVGCCRSYGPSSRLLSSYLSPQPARTGCPGAGPGRSVYRPPPRRGTLPDSTDFTNADGIHAALPKSPRCGNIRGHVSNPNSWPGTRRRPFAPLRRRGQDVCRALRHTIVETHADTARAAGGCNCYQQQRPVWSSRNLFAPIRRASALPGGQRRAGICSRYSRPHHRTSGSARRHPCRAPCLAGLFPGDGRGRSAFHPAESGRTPRCRSSRWTLCLCDRWNTACPGRTVGSRQRRQRGNFP